MNKNNLEISSVIEYIKIIENIEKSNEQNGNNADLLFRGQGIDKPLLPKLARLDLNGDITNIEKLMLKEFKRCSLPLTEFQPENNWDWLALAQHHGLPTRLLDWSYSALVALWFAVEREPVEIDGQKQNGVIWVLNGEVSDFRINTETTDPLSNKITKIFRSSVVSKRISSQSGVFTCHKITESGKFIQFETNKEFKTKLSKIKIPYDYFPSIRKQLHTLGVNSSTIYPDIDGFCKHLQWRFSKYSDEK